MGIGGSRSFCRFLLLSALALAGCPFSADDDGDGMNAGAGGDAGSSGTSGSGGGGPGGTGGSSGGTGGTGGASGGTGGTGGASGGTGGTGGSAVDEPDPDFADLDARLEQGNHCESLDECVAVHVAPCSTRYVSSSEDVETLQSDLDAWAAAEGLDQLGCLALCQCGVLTCTEGKCTTAVDTDCDAAESPTERVVCL